MGDVWSVWVCACVRAYVRTCVHLCAQMRVCTCEHMRVGLCLVVQMHSLVTGKKVLIQIKSAQSYIERNRENAAWYLFPLLSDLFSIQFSPLSSVPHTVDLQFSGFCLNDFLHTPNLLHKISHKIFMAYLGDILFKALQLSNFPWNVGPNVVC